VAARGKWAQGIVPRNFCWVIKDRLALCERPGGYGEIREQGFTHVVSLLGSPHNLHNYDELGVAWLHRPFHHSEGREAMERFYPELRRLLGEGNKLVLHQAEVNDGLTGLLAGYLLWSGLVPTGPQAISIMEQIAGRQLGPVGRGLVTAALDLANRSGRAPSRR
jgi:hypothetical protein